MDTLTDSPEIINRVAQSGIITLDLEDYYFAGPRLELDLAAWMWQGLILREREFRDHVGTHDWAQYAGAAVRVFCSEPEALVQSWAYMLVASRLAGTAYCVVAGSTQDLEGQLFRQAFDNLDVTTLTGARVVVKGCSDKPVPESAYLDIALLLTPHVSSLMFGEACSAVPVYKKKKQV